MWRWKVTDRNEARQQAKRKLDLINARAGREYGQDGYGDGYLEILTDEILYLDSCSRYLFRDCRQKMEAWG